MEDESDDRTSDSDYTPFGGEHKSKADEDSDDEESSSSNGDISTDSDDIIILQNTKPKITDMFSSKQRVEKQETDLDRAIAASIKSATDDERRRRKRKKCIRESDSDNDSSDQQ
eukprot:205386_1